MMDRFGRIPVISGGFALGAAGCGVTALATRTSSTLLVIAGFGLIGAAGAIALLIRTAAGDMYPPERRARGISYVLFGSVFGAILGPTVFSPMFAGKDVEAGALTVPWLAAGGISLIALVIVQFVRPDPKRIAELIHSRDDEPPPAAAPLLEIVRRPGVKPGDAGGACELRRDGLRDEPVRLRRRRAPSPSPGLRLSDHRRPRVRDVRARARDRRVDRPRRAHSCARG